MGVGSDAPGAGGTTALAWAVTVASVELTAHLVVLAGRTGIPPTGRALLGAVLATRAAALVAARRRSATGIFVVLVWEAAGLWVALVAPWAWPWRALQATTAAVVIGLLVGAVPAPGGPRPPRRP